MFLPIETYSQAFILITYFIVLKKLKENNFILLILLLIRNSECRFSGFL